MPKVIPFRRRNRAADADAPPRHRREGHFDDQDVWHDAESETDVTAVVSL